MGSTLSANFQASGAPCAGSSGLGFRVLGLELRVLWVALEELELSCHTMVIKGLGFNVTMLWVYRVKGLS